MNRIELENYISNFVYPLPFYLYKSLSDSFFFEDRDGDGIVSPDLVACLVTPCTNLDGGILEHRMKFPITVNLSKEEIDKIINVTILEAQNCKVSKHG